MALKGVKGPKLTSTQAVAIVNEYLKHKPRFPPPKS